MKKFVPIFVILSMILSIVAVNTSAAPGLYIDQAFDTMEEFTQDFAAGAFYTNNEGLLFGYAEARALQSINNHVWNTYDVEVTIAFSDDEMSEAPRNLNLSYPNTNLEFYGRFDGTCYTNFVLDFDKDEILLVAGGGADYDEEDTVLAGPISRDLKDDGTTYYKFGMSVDKGRIRCFLDGELLFDYVDTNNEWMIAYETEEPFLLWNEGNFMSIDHVKVSSVGFLFPYAPETSETETSETEGTVATEATTTQGGEEEVTTPKATSETTTKIVEEVITNDVGETEIVTKIETEGTTTPAADTNVNKPQSGSSTATGDATFVVVAAMVAALGCALVVKKVNAK